MCGVFYGAECSVQGILRRLTQKSVGQGYLVITWQSLYFIGAVNQHPNDHNKAMAKEICTLIVHFTAVLKWMGWERACRVRYIFASCHSLYGSSR